MYAGHFLTKAIDRIEKYAFKEFFESGQYLFFSVTEICFPVKKFLVEDTFISV